jgi:hypothetical protein
LRRIRSSGGPVGPVSTVAAVGVVRRHGAAGNAENMSAGAEIDEHVQENGFEGWSVLRGKGRS